MFRMHLLILILGTFCVSAHASSLNTKHDGKVNVHRLSTHYDRVRRSAECHFPPFLRFEFNVNDINITLNLEKNPRISSNVTIYVPDKENKVLKSDVNDHQNFALYHDKNRGSAMLVTCEGELLYKLKGSFKYQGISYHMTPSNEPEVTNVHHIHRDHEQTIEFDWGGVEIKDIKAERPSKDKDRRKKREIPPENIVELLFSVDYSTYKMYFEEEGTDFAAQVAIEEHVLMLANEMDIYYAGIPDVDPSVNIRIRAAGVWINNDSSVVDWSSSSTRTVGEDKYLDYNSLIPNIKVWRDAQIGLHPHDHLMALSVVDFAFINDTTLEVFNSPTGRSYLCTMCKYSHLYSVSFSELRFNGRTAQTMAHELGHALCAFHDVSDICPPDNNNVMTSRFSVTTNSTYAMAQWTFSTCSVKEFKDFLDGLEQPDGNCMLTHTSEYDVNIHSLPGEEYSLTEQCTMYQGFDSYACSEVSESSCHSGMHCYNETGGCSSAYYPLYPLTGTPCGGSAEEKICYKGTCVPKEDVITPPTTPKPCSNKKCCIWKKGRKRCCKKSKCCKRKFLKKCGEFCCT